MAQYIPDEFYVGFHTNGDDVIGFMTPNGTDKAAEKRKATVNSWRNKAIEPITIKNEPIHGFRLVKHIVRHGGGVVIQVLDPRGFHLEISIDNFMTLLKCGSMIDMEYQSPCVWVRDEAVNRLMSVNDPRYLKWKPVTVKIPERKEPAPKALKVSELQIGDIVTMKDGRTALYGGRQMMVDFTTGNFNPRKYHLYRVEENGRFNGKVLRTFSSIFIDVKERQVMDYDAFMAGANHVSGYVMGDVGKPSVSVDHRGSDDAKIYIGDYRIHRPTSTLWHYGKGKVAKVIDGIITVSSIHHFPYYDNAHAFFTVRYQTKDGPLTFTFT